MGILKMSLSATVLILAIVIIRALALHRLPKITFLVLWAVALCRLLIPFSVPSIFSIYTFANMLKTRFSTIETTVTGMTPISIGTAANTINTSLTKTASINISPLMVVWFIGLSACALFFLVTHLRWCREYKTALPVDNEFVRDWHRSHPTRRKVKIRQSDRIATPLAYGLFRPVILLPKGTDWTNEKHLEYILIHELVHIRRFDTFIKLLLVAAVCVHWFNPLVWIMYVLANRDIELSCDETVIRTYGEKIKSAYALTLIGLEEKKSGLAPLVNNFSKYSTEERIEAIMKAKKMSLMGIILALALVIGTTTVFATSAASASEKNDPAKSTATLEQSPLPVPPRETADVALTPSVSVQSGATESDSDANHPSSAANDNVAALKPAPVDSGIPQNPAPVPSGQTETKSDYVYPVNKNGETYGTSAFGNPDLIAAVGTEGQDGYIRERDMPGANVNTPEEAAKYMEWRKTQPSTIMIPLYDREGNVIGKFGVSNGGLSSESTKGLSLAEAQELVENAG